MNRFRSKAVRRSLSADKASELKADASSSSPLSVMSSVPDMLSKMASYFDSMVDRRSHRFYYRCLPESGTKIHSHCPIRDLGSAWDTATLLRLGPANLVEQYPLLSKAVVATIHAYSSSTSWFTFLDPNDGDQPPCAALPSSLLQEPSNIAHSAFLILATTGAIRLNLLEERSPPANMVPLNDLINGILSMQQQGTGAFAIHFLGNNNNNKDDIFRGIEFYPGEAMLALLDAYQEVPDLLSPATRQRIVPAIKEAFLFYSDFYRGGHVDVRYTSFFGNWQVQCFARLHDILLLQPQDLSESTTKKKTETGPWLSDASQVTAAMVADYVWELCDAIVRSSPWRTLDDGYCNRLSTVEIACGLEALAEGMRLTTAMESAGNSDEAADRGRIYWHNIKNAVRFLAAVQGQVQQPDVAGYGGLGFGLNVSEQRLDVTGHAINALIKVSHLQASL